MSFVTFVSVYKLMTLVIFFLRLPCRPNSGINTCCVTNVAHSDKCRIKIQLFVPGITVFLSYPIPLVFKLHNARVHAHIYHQRRYYN